MSMGDMDNPNRRRNLGFFFDQAIARVPDKVAIIDLFGGRERCTTYRQLGERMETVALAARLPLRHRLLLDERAEGFLAFEDEMAKPGPPVEPPPIADDAQAF